MIDLNSYITGAFDACYEPMAEWPAWLSLGVISAVVGILLLLAYKYTSNQGGIERARDKIKARMLAMRLYKDNLRVMGASQVAVMGASLRILLLSIPPVLVAMVPLMPLLAQMASRYFFAPVPVGREVLVTAFVTDDFAQSEAAGNSTIELVAPEGVSLAAGPWREPATGDAPRRMVKWKLAADRPGPHLLTIRTNTGTPDEWGCTKELPVGAPGDFKKAISPKWTTFYSGMLDNPIMMPWESPPTEKGPIRAVEVSDMLHLAAPDVLPIPILGNWIVYFLVVSIIFALLAKPFLGVKL